METQWNRNNRSTKLKVIIVEMLNKVTSTMVQGEGQAAGEQVNLNELDAQMEQIKDMFVKKQEMMKKMSTTQAPNPNELAA